jgi:hypothetical protein
VTGTAAATLARAQQRTTTLRSAAVGGLILFLVAAPAAGHERTVSFSSWKIDGRNAHITARLTPLDVSRLPWAQGLDGPELDRRLGAYLAESLGLRAGGEPCPLAQPPARLATAPDRIAFEWEVVCPPSGALEVHSALLRDVATGHLHFARVHQDGGPLRERVLTDAAASWRLAAAETAPAATLPGYLMLGVEHILTGYDHLVFLIGLLLLGGTLRDLVRVVTGFTVAHSVTLALAVFGIVRPAQAPIEALIGLSIALIAAENLWLAAGRPTAVRWCISGALLCAAVWAWVGPGTVPATTLAGLAFFTASYFTLLARVERPAPLRAAVAFLFGLVHGFGFAGVLLEAELPSRHLAVALFGFNAGVELGQVAAVLMLWPLLRLTQRIGNGRLHLGVIEYGSAAILAVGVFWFVIRSYG